MLFSSLTLFLTLGVHAVQAAPEPLVVGAHTFWLETLPNGLLAMSVEDPSATEASVFVVYAVGNRMESAETHGLAHLTEHILFSGTTRTPMGDLIARVESLGGEANAYTRDDFTVYYDHQVPHTSIPEVLALEADRMRGIRFEPADFAVEQGRLATEESHTSQPTLQLQDWRRAAVFGNQSYGAGVADARGWSRAPELPLEAVRDFYDQWYQPQHAAVVVVGPPHEDVLPQIADAFGPIPAGEVPPRDDVAITVALPEPGSVTIPSGLTRHRTEWVWSGPPLSETRDRLALEALAVQHGNRMTDEGYPLDVVVDGMMGASLFVMAATGADAEDTLAALHAEVLAVDISDADMAALRQMLRGRYADQPLQSRPYFSLAVDVAVHARWGLVSVPSTFAEQVDALTVADLRAAAARWLQPQAAWTIHFLPDEAATTGLPADREGLYEAAIAASESGDLVRAIAAYERLLALGANPMNTVIYRYTLGELSYRLGRYGDARRHLEAGLAITEYPALRELLEEVNAADGGAPVARTSGGDPAPPTAPSDARVVGTTGDAPAWAEEASGVMGQLESWRGRTFSEDIIVRFEADAGEGLAGYYDPATQALVVGLSSSDRFNQGTMLHEMYHALQDQHFGLARLQAAATEMDAERALGAVIEGEAMLAVAELMDYDFLAHATLPADGALDSARFEKIFRYGDGQRFILHLRDVGGWSLVDRALSEPPKTSAEIYHPERYLAGWEPLSARRIPASPVPAGMTTLQQEAAGEYGLRIFLAGAPETRSLAPVLGAALAGDQHTIAEGADGTVWMSWVLVFTDIDSATRFQAVAPTAAAAVPAVSALEVSAVEPLRRGMGYAVSLSWTLSDSLR